jgi:hypothetical protein
MRARGWWFAALIAVPIAAFAEPKPSVVEIKSFRDQLIVLRDAQGGTYVVLPGSDSRAWYGGAKTLYEQVVLTRTSNGETGEWSLGAWAPRIATLQPGVLQRRDDGTFEKFCGEKQVGLTQLTGDKAKQVLDKSTFMSTALTRRPHILGRDDAGIYYYVDVIRDQYGGKGYRVFVGKKGAMKELPLSDIASDTAGEVFATKTGDLRFVHNSEDGKNTATWVHGEKRTPLIMLDTDANSAVIFKDLGVYTFTGTICDDT